jgi:hypothetical protein
VRLPIEALVDYVASVGEQMERFGVDMDPPGEPIRARSGSRGVSYQLAGALPHAPGDPSATLTVTEAWRRVDDRLFERTEYAYELLDRLRRFRRAWHRHHQEWFADRFQVIVHEHCEHPIGEAACEHYTGFPVRDAFAGVELLLDAWMDPQPPDCGSLRCLEPT